MGLGQDWISSSPDHYLPSILCMYICTFMSMPSVLHNEEKGLVSLPAPISLYACYCAIEPYLGLAHETKAVCDNWRKLNCTMMESLNTYV